MWDSMTTMLSLGLIKQVAVLTLFNYRWLPIRHNHEWLTVAMHDWNDFFLFLTLTSCLIKAAIILA